MKLKKKIKSKAKFKITLNEEEVYLLFTILFREVPYDIKESLWKGKVALYNKTQPFALKLAKIILGLSDIVDKYKEEN